MTRSLMIFGQGAILLPSVGDEGNEGRAAGRIRSERIDEFDRNLFGHIGFAISNAVRSFWFGLTASHDRQGARRRLHAPLLSQARSLFGRAGADGRHLDAAARRQAQVQGIAVRAPGRRAQPTSTSPAPCSSATRTKAVRSATSRCWRGRSTTAMQQDRDWRCPARCATSRSARSAGCCGCWCSRWGRRAQAPSDRLGHRAAALLMTPCDARAAPGRRRVPDARATTIRPAASTATCPR